MGALFSKGASMEFLGIHGLSGRLRTYLEPGPKPSLDDATPSSLRASRNVLFWPMGLSLPSNPAARASASMSATAIGPADKTLRRKSAASSLPDRLSPPPLVSDASSASSTDAVTWSLSQLILEA